MERREGSPAITRLLERSIPVLLASGPLSSWDAPQDPERDPSTVSSWLYDFVKFPNVSSINCNWLESLSILVLTPLCHISPHRGVSVRAMGILGN